MRWRRSSYSNAQGGDCLEVAGRGPGALAVRDSKRPGGATLRFSTRAWGAFVAAVRSA
ncbi:hypothetical protein GCM10018785_13600 [Streptomyces longispororuber]|uniref:DUF397 domain-containing protein n=1 Tax=Streptomyces longispororuber TaxID=68230 RepID=A0A919DIK3_9ACTN|nr:DUF397 domain-containing protein [Streptomyces longispororuber]GHE45237.1 hypothetical protein GCM10018785_13600 [Streptomyces longispororuber]